MKVLKNESSGKKPGLLICFLTECKSGASKLSTISEAVYSGFSIQ